VTGSLAGAGPAKHDERTRDLAERRDHEYICPDGHVTELTFAAEAVPPSEWACRRCSAAALLDGVAVEQVPSQSEPRESAATPMDRLRQRRSEPELEELLAEAVRQYRENGYAFGQTGGRAG
jgi:hypothetical protein